MKKITKSIISLIMAFAFVISISTSVFALDTSYSSIFAIGKGTNYFQVDGSNASGLQSVNYVEYKPNTGVTPMIAYGSKLYGMSTITYVADYLESQGKDVIAGINADFFDMATGVPVGIVISEGVFISSNSGSPAIGFMKDGTAIIGTPANTMYITGEKGQKVKVHGFNKTRSQATVCLYDENFGSTTKTSTIGTNIVLERVNSEELQVNGDVKLKVVSITKDTTTAASIGKNQMVLTASNDCLIDIKQFEVGEVVTFTVNAEETAWNNVEYAVSGKVLLDNKVIDVTGSPTGNNPRSAVGIKADGTVVLYEVDGRQSGFSVGMTMNQLANELLALGCVDAINLDGGGSSAMIIQKTGESKYAVVNSPSEGSLRKCANYIMLVNNQSATGNLANLAIYPDYKYVMKNSSVGLKVKAADSAFYPVNTPANVAYSVLKGGGSISGSTYYSGSNNGTVTLKATSGNATGQQNIYVVAGVTSMSVVKSGTTSAVTSLNPEPESKINLNLYNVKYNGKAVKPDDKAVTWSTDFGTIDNEGNYTAPKTSGSGTIKVAYGNYVKSISVTVQSTDLEENTTDFLVADFENSKDFKGNASAVSLDKTYGNVHNGYQSLAVKYNVASGNDKLAYTGNKSDVGSATKIYGWFKGDGKGVKVTALFTDASGNTLTAAMSGGLNQTDYVLCVGNIPANAEKFEGFLLTKGSSDSGTIYIDQVVMSNQTTADKNYPVIKFTNYPEKVNSGANASVIANVSDTNGTVAIAKGNIKVYLDGKVIAFNYNAVTGNVAFSTGSLDQGLHRLTIEAVDVFGNVSRKSVNLNAGTSSSVFADTQKHWAKSHIDFVAAQEIVKGENVGGKTYFNPGRNLTRAEFAVIMARFLNLEAGNYNLPYADNGIVKAWALDSVKALYEAGIMTGSNVGGKTYFYPNQSITRQEVMTVISKSMQNGYYVTNHKFTDLASIPNWSLPHINKLVSLEIVGGYNDGTILPKNNITRAEIAKIVYGLF